MSRVSPADPLQRELAVALTKFSFDLLGIVVEYVGVPRPGQRFNAIHLCPEIEHDIEAHVTILAVRWQPSSLQCKVRWERRKELEEHTSCYEYREHRRPDEWMNSMRLQPFAAITTYPATYRNPYEEVD